MWQGTSQGDDHTAVARLDQACRRQPGADRHQATQPIGRQHPTPPDDVRGLTIREGKVFARAPGGQLQFRSAGLRDYGAANPALQLVVQALDDFQFDQLDSDLSYDEDGKLQLALHLSGRNPAIEEGRLINFNIHLEENLPALITSLQLSERVSETIRERVRERVEGKSSKPGKKKARD